MKWVAIFTTSDLDRIDDKKTDLFWIKYGYIPEEEWKLNWKAEMYRFRRPFGRWVRYADESVWYEMVWKRALKQTTKVMKEDIGYLL